MAANPAFASTPARNFVQFGTTAVTSRNPSSTTGMGLLVDGATSGTVVSQIRIMPSATITNPGCVTVFIMDDGAATTFSLLRDWSYSAQTPSTTTAAQPVAVEIFTTPFVVKSSQKLYVATTITNTLNAHVEAADV